MPSVFEPLWTQSNDYYEIWRSSYCCKNWGLRDTVVDFTDTHHHSKNQGIGVAFDEHNMFWYMHAITKLSHYMQIKKNISNLQNTI
jgi:glycogen synthase